MSSECAISSAGSTRSGRLGSRRGWAVGARRPGILTAVLVLGVVGAIAGCGASTSAGAVSTSGSAPAPGSSVPAAAPNPNAPDIAAAGDIPDNQVFVPFTGATYTASVPQGWARSSEGTAAVFSDKFNSVRFESLPLAAAPDVGSVRAHDVPQLRGSVPGFALGDVQVVQRPAGSAVLVTYEATSAPNAVTGKSVTEAVERYAFWRGGQQVVVTLSGPTGADNVDPWRKITDSLRWQQ